MSIRLAIFDIAGTTVKDPDGVGGALKSALTAAGVPWQEGEVNAIMGTPKPIAIGELLRLAGMPSGPEQVEPIFRDFQARMIEYYRNDPSIEPVPGAVETFRTLREHGIKVVLDTGFDRSIVDVLLERLGWGTDLLDATVTSDEVPQGRPFPDLVFEAMARTGIESVSEVAKIGDTPSDLQEGTAANCALVVGVTSGTHTEAELALHPHTHLIYSVREFPALLS